MIAGPRRARTSSLRRASRGDDGGTVLVETALVLPIILLLALGLAEYATAEFQQSQASSAARDGARVGILDYRTADVDGSVAHQEVVDAVNARLTGRTDAEVAVTCLDPAGATIACSSAVADRDRIQVEVEWPYAEVTGVMPVVPSTIAGTSRMRLAGTPIDTSSSTTSTSSTSTSSTTSTTSPSGECQVLEVTVNDGDSTDLPQVNEASGKLTDGLYVYVETNGSSECLPVDVVVFPEGGGAATGSPLAASGQSTSGGVYESIFTKNPPGVTWSTGPLLIQVTTGDLPAQDVTRELTAK
jgi:Flp pilus assembly protein TadG